jgi:hypothetical protein
VARGVPTASGIHPKRKISLGSHPGSSKPAKLAIQKMNLDFDFIELNNLKRRLDFIEVPRSGGTEG